MTIYDTAKAASYVGLGKSTLEKLRVTGGGPRFLKLGKRRVGYLTTDLDEWLTSRPRVESTSALGLEAA